MPKNVADLKIPGDDAMGVAIVTIYGCKAPEYAVYRTRARVLVQYGDPPQLAADQRKAMARLNPLRGEINGLVDGWRSKPEGSALQSKAERYDRRTGDALILAFEDDVAGAEILLQAVKRDILDERIATARFEYLTSAFAAALLAVFLAFLFTSFGSAPMAAAEIWRAAGAGAVGAFFSISVGIRGRTVLPDLQRTANLMDSVLRILIGMIAAAVLVAFIRSGAMKFDIGSASSDAKAENAWLYILLVGFIAGFSERIVPDLLAKVSSTTSPAAPATAATGTASPKTDAKPPTSPAGAGAPAGTPPPSEDAEQPDPEAASDHCASDIALKDDEVTPDNALPAAAGGVDAAQPSQGSPS